MAIVLVFMASNSVSETEGRRLGTLALLICDANRDTYAFLEEQLMQANNVLLSIDADDNGTLSKEKISTLGFGVEDVAVETDRKQAF